MLLVGGFVGGRGEGGGGQHPGADESGRNAVVQVMTQPPAFFLAGQHEVLASTLKLEACTARLGSKSGLRGQVL